MDSNTFFIKKAKEINNKVFLAKQKIKNNKIKKNDVVAFKKLVSLINSWNKEAEKLFNDGRFKTKIHIENFSKKDFEDFVNNGVKN